MNWVDLDHCEKCAEIETKIAKLQDEIRFLNSAIKEWKGTQQAYKRIVKDLLDQVKKLDGKT